MRIVVCGGRDYKDAAYVYQVLDGYLEEARSRGEELVVIQGGASGVDALAAQWGRYRGGSTYVVTFPADWSLGKKAGPLRNQRMLEEGKPDLVIAFPGGRGTADCLRRAIAMGISTFEVCE